MPRFGRIRRRDLIHYLKQIDFEGPYGAGKHQFMTKDDVTVRLPIPHRGDIGQELLARVLRQAGIDRGQREML